MQLVYDYSGRVYKELGDPKPTLRRIYTAVEFLNSIVKGKLPNLSEEKKEEYLMFIEESIMESKKDIDEIRDSVVQDRKTKKLEELKSLIVWHCILLFIFFSIGLKIVVKKVVKYLEDITIWSECMIKMMPYWLIRKNK